MSRSLVAALLAVALLAAAPTARARPDRPGVFFILARGVAPVAEDALPEAARRIHRELLLLRRRAREVMARRPRGDVERIMEEIERAEGLLLVALARATTELSADGWLVHGDLLAIRITAHWADATDRAMEHGGEPPPLELGPAIASWRRSSALGGTGRAATWARYYEAWALSEMFRLDEARAALAIVAASNERELAAEARLRLGELAFDDAPALAAEWYTRALPDLAPRLVGIARYRLAWSLFRTERATEARAAAAGLPADAPPEMRAELDELLSERP